MIFCGHCLSTFSPQIFLASLPFAPVTFVLPGCAAPQVSLAGSAAKDDMTKVHFDFQLQHPLYALIINLSLI
jgi:hypothetical protein